MNYDPELVDYNSPAFQRGFDAAPRGNEPLPMPVRPPGMSDVEWASYCEGYLMGSCEDE